jgi:UDPglucose--hexose-1-phosphate uridylyltransferase
MPELRQNLITRDWVIIATERAKRPDEFAKKHDEPLLPPHDPNCPFCPGNESTQSPPTFELKENGEWKVRIIANKFPALSPVGERQLNIDGVHRSMAGVGLHEVVVENRLHNTTTALLSDHEVANILTAYKERYISIKRDPRVEATIIFKNHGESAGTSLAHPHSQVAATPIVPNQIRKRMEEAARYHDDNGECVYCRSLKDELVEDKRIILQTEHFVAFIPYAALSPFHTWIFPRRHASEFDQITRAEIEDLSRVLRSILARLYYGLNNPDYNYTIRSGPLREGEREYIHWYLTIIPRVNKTAGFELGSGMYINTSLPEESAAFLRNVKLPNMR